MGFRDALTTGPADDDLNRFDRAGDDLAHFDTASGATAVPAGTYLCTVARGELVTTKKGKTAYRLAFDVAAGEHAGFRLWRYYLFDTLAAANRAKAALAPLGLTSSAALRQQFPAPGRVVTARVLVGVQARDDGTTGNDVERFSVESDAAAPPNPNAVDPDALAGGEGGAA